MGADGSLTGYGGGIKNKISLLENEGNNMSKYFLPKRKSKDSSNLTELT